MLYPPKSHLAPFVAILVLCAIAQAARQTGARPSLVRQIMVQKISIAASEPLQVQVQTSSPATPQVQAITGPERLVIDVPGATPGATLRNQSVNRDDVQRLRIGLFSASPPITRIVLDLNSPQPYHITPTASGFTVVLGAQNPQAENPSPSAQSSDEDASNQAVIGWVSNTVASSTVPSRPTSFVIKKHDQEPARPVLVQYASGQLEIHAHDAPLSDVLAMVQQQTGAEIAIPPFTREERVVGDFGPGTASEVLAQLLNGTNMNFVVVASPTDPSALRNVILSLKTEGVAEYPPVDSASTAPNAISSDNNPSPVVEPRPEDIPQSQPPDSPAPPPDTPQN